MKSTLEVNQNGIVVFVSDTGSVLLRYALDSETDVERDFHSVVEAEIKYGKKLSEVDMFDIMND